MLQMSAGRGRTMSGPSLAHNADHLYALRVALTCGRPRCPCTRGKMLHCPSHQDGNPSLSVRIDSRRILVHCFGGCSQTEVLDQLRTFRLWPSAQVQAQPPRLRSVLNEALALARRQPWTRPGVLFRYRRSDEIRRHYRLAEGLRREATMTARAASLGDTPAVWQILALAAVVEREGLALETELDEVSP
jgi:hypothetical protein